MEHSSDTSELNPLSTFRGPSIIQELVWYGHYYHHFTISGLTKCVSVFSIFFGLRLTMDDWEDKGQSECGPLPRRS